MSESRIEARNALAAARFYAKNGFQAIGAPWDLRLGDLAKAEGRDVDNAIMEASRG